jgi:purine-binding chemotaxis protein CheW
VPNVPDWLLGIANLRGDIVSLVDIKKFLGMGPFDAGMHDRIIMLRSFNEDLCTAVIVNRIAGMHHVADEDIILNDAGGRDSEPYIGGVYERDGRTIVVLDIERMLLSDDMQQFRAL